jgi:hypothetical protein
MNKTTPQPKEKKITRKKQLSINERLVHNEVRTTNLWHSLNALEDYVDETVGKSTIAFVVAILSAVVSIIAIIAVYHSK